MILVNHFIFHHFLSNRQYGKKYELEKNFYFSFQPILFIIEPSNK